jgi:RES domain-containing protein
MIVYRITLEKWAHSLSGSGYPARWNSKGRYVIYTAGTRALACLENLAHRSGEGLDHLFCVIEIKLPEPASVQTVDAISLPGNWFHPDAYPLCQAIGDSWIEMNESLILRVPSSIIPDEYNILINPGHPEFRDVTIHDVKSFRFDRRLK